MELKILQLTEEQCAELEDMQAEIMRMFVASPRRPGAILAQIIPPMGIMRVRLLDSDIAARLMRILPPEWGNE